MLANRWDLIQGLKG